MINRSKVSPEGSRKRCRSSPLRCLHKGNSDFASSSPTLAWSWKQGFHPDRLHNNSILYIRPATFNAMTSIMSTQTAWQGPTGSGTLPLRSMTTMRREPPRHPKVEANQELISAPLDASLQRLPNRLEITGRLIAVVRQTLESHATVVSGKPRPDPRESSHGWSPTQGDKEPSPRQRPSFAWPHPRLGYGSPWSVAGRREGKTDTCIILTVDPSMEMFGQSMKLHILVLKCLVQKKVHL
jgi:hypothetical protein